MVEPLSVNTFGTHIAYVNTNHYILCSAAHTPFLLIGYQKTSSQRLNELSTAETAAVQICKNTRENEQVIYSLFRRTCCTTPLALA